METNTIPRFRDLSKQQVRGRLPDDLEELIRERAYRERRSISSVLTELVATGAGLDPRIYGIEISPSNTLISV
jgi:hypothetical protein